MASAPGEPRAAALALRFAAAIAAGAAGLVFVYRGLAGALRRNLESTDLLAASLGVVVLVAAVAFLARTLRSSTSASRR